MKRLLAVGLILVISLFASGCSNLVEALNQPVETDFEGELKVYYFDVGQGDSIYIKTPNGDDILIDAGDNNYGDDVVNYLNELNVDDIEVLIATHPHADHIGGLDTVLENFTVEAVYAPKVVHTSQTYEDFLLGVANEGLKITKAEAGVTIPLEGVEAKFVGPVGEYESLNNWSAVLHLTYGNTAFLFSGDAEIEAEHDILELNQNIKADVYKVGHHGSSTSTTDKYLAAINPEYAVISSGIDNRYGHPHQETLTKLNSNGINIFRTDEKGTIIFTSDGNNISSELK